MADEIDFSKAIEQVKEMLSSDEGGNQLQGIFNMLKGDGGEANNNCSNGNTPFSALPSGDSPDLLSGLGDMATLMKLQKIMSALSQQKNDSNTVFLQSLKPFLSPSRQSKLDDAAKILSVSKAIKAFKESER